MSFKNLTYGVEIEGIFTTDLVHRLNDIPGVALDMKDDGSVNEDSLRREAEKAYSDELTIGIEDGQEINLGIFHTKKMLLQTLAKVESKKNHFWDKSCGLHLHLKTEEDMDLMVSRTFDKKFLYTIQQYAVKNLCDHIRPRVKNHYCRAYYGLKEIIYATHSRTNPKYRFVRHHPSYDTLEFRFFSPCEHKVENVRKFLSFFMREIEKVKPYYKHTFLMNTTKQEVLIKKDYKVLAEREVSTELNYAINKTKKKGGFMDSFSYAYSLYSERLRRMATDRTLRLVEQSLEAEEDSDND